LWNLYRLCFSSTVNKIFSVNEKENPDLSFIFVIDHFNDSSPYDFYFKYSQWPEHDYDKYWNIKVFDYSDNYSKRKKKNGEMIIIITRNCLFIECQKYSLLQIERLF